MKKFQIRSTAVETAIAFLLVFLTAYYDIFYSFDCLLRDKIYQTPRGINNKIKIIAIDDETLNELGPFGTWSRGTYADVIAALGDYPDVIAMDIMLFGDMESEGDERLKSVCAESGRVVSGSYINYSSVYKTDENGKHYIDRFNIDDVTEPIVSEQCETGFVNASPDEDGVIRSAFVSARHGETEYQSIAAAAYSMYCEKNDMEKNIPALDKDGRMWISYAGRPFDYEHISFCRVLDGTVDPRIFNGCIVLVGAYAAGLQDQFSVPNSSDLMYGVEIHANIIQGLLDGKTPVPANREAAALVSAFFAAAAYLISKRFRIKASTPCVILLAVGSVGLGAFANSAGTAYPLLYAPLFSVIGYILNLVRNYVHEAAEKRKITAAFKKYVAPQVVEEISKSGKYHIKLGGENRHIAVLFVDIRGFTPMSESLEPEQVVDILNTYLNLTANSVFANGGTLDKFIGDATMAVFNAPFDLDDYVFRAVKTAWDIIGGGNEIEEKFLEKYGKSVSFGVGVNCGNAVVGNIGCDFRMDYTAIGDTVNTAARLESNAKRGQALISEEVYNRVKDRITAEPIGEIPLKGKSKGVFVYSLTGIKSERNGENE